MLNQIRKWYARSKVDLNHIDPRFRRKAYRNVDWRNEDLSQFVPVGCRFENCNFEGVKFDSVCFGGGLEDTEYIQCNFNNTIIFSRAAGNAIFIGCTFQDVYIKELFTFNIEMVNCIFTGTIRRAVFNGQVPDDSQSALGRKRNKFEGNDFSGARLADVAFRSGIDIALQKFPQGWVNRA